MDFNQLKKLIFILIFFYSKSYYQEYESKTYANSRDIQSYNFIDLENNLIDDFANNKFKIKITPLFYNSIDNNEFNNYFLIDKKDTLKLSGDNNSNKFNRDIRADFLSLDSDSDFLIDSKLKEKNYSLIFDFKSNLKNLIKTENFSNFVIGLKTILSKKINNLKINTIDKLNKKNFINFFKSKSKFMKITNEELENLNFESFIITLGSFYKSKNNTFNIYYFSGIEIPTMKDNFCSDLFFPVIGNNGHFGIQMGAKALINLHETEKTKFGIISAIENHFKFYRTHLLTFDLKNKPWSRYLPVINKTNYNETKYLNEISTLPARIHPCNNLDLTIGLSLSRLLKNESLLDFNLGLNFWIKQKEYIELMDREHKNIYRDFYSYGIKGTTPGSTASNSNISYLSNDDRDFVNFNITNLDLGSVNKDGAFSKSIFCKINFENENFISSVGAWGEIGDKNISSKIGGFITIGCKW